MKLNANTLLVVGAACAAVATVAVTQQPRASQSTEVRPHPKLVPGVVQFAAGAPELSSLKVAAVSEAALPVAEPVNGRITYDENVTARISSPVLGRVLTSHAEVGDKVIRGAVLLHIDSPDLATAESEWRKSRADAVRKKLAFERARSLFEHDVIARKDYEAAGAEFQQTIAELRRTALRMRSLNASGEDNGRFRLKTPIAGVIAAKQVNPGLEVRPDRSDPLFIVTDVERLWVIADVPERSIANVRPGQTVRVETDAYPHEFFPATVDRVGLALDPTTRRLQVRCTLRNPGRKLKPEMFARISFLADGDKHGMLVPNASLVVDGLHNYLFVEQQQGTFVKRRVKLALRSSDSSYIEQGLASGERVVTEGALLLNSAAISF